MRTLGKRKGAVLIVVLGVLAVLALLATTFASLQATERQVARNYLDTVRAKLLAESGVSDGEARLRENFPFRYFNTLNPGAPQPWKWWGIDALPWETREPNAKDKLEDTTNPSFAIEDEPIQNPLDANVAPKQIKIEGRNRGLSGYMNTNTYGALHGDNYSLKVSDLSGRIYVNDGITGGPNGSVSQNLKRILNVLGDVLQSPLLGDKIVGNRPTTGYRSAQDLIKALNYDENLYQRVKPHVTVYAWVDPNVVNPVPLSAVAAANNPSVQYYRGNPSVYRYTSTKDAAGIEASAAGGLNTLPTVGNPMPSENAAVCVYGLDQLNPLWVEVVSRAPVNVNSATREVLVALLTDVKGFFLADRRRNNPRWKGDLYLSFKQQSSFRSGSTVCSEIGYLTETVPIVGPSGTASSGISAFEIADEIIACRNRAAGKYGNYSSEPFGGPFKTWHQFYAFIDFLVTAGLITDNRTNLHVDYIQETDDPAGYGSLVPSDYQRDNASKACADAIKANFNPNCHLNELNPDENLYLRVDKTDLMVNSTEFTFMPTGLFEIESLGRVLRPVDPAVGDCYLGDNNLMAQAKVTAIYKLYDMYRETNFKQFYAGTLPASTGAMGAVTNNNMSLEIGPEVDNGKFVGNLGDATAPPDNEWDGYIALPTIGGDFHSNGAKQKNTMVTTMNRGGAGLYNGALAHGHFQWDFDLHAHPFDPHEIASKDNADEHVWNYPKSNMGSDLSYRAPYAPTMGTVTNGIPFHRNCRSFRQTMGSSGTVTQPALAPYVPSNLRIDGGYVERHSGAAYYAYKGSQALFTLFGSNQSGGTNGAAATVAFWWKPSYFPNLTGKVRYQYDFSRYHTPCGQNVYVWPWTLAYYPSHYIVSVEESNGPLYWHNNVGQFLPSSLCWGSKAWHDVSQDHEFGSLTTSLNHLDHVKENPACATKPSPLQAHRWIHTAASVWLNNTWDQGQNSSHLYVNGNSLLVPFTFTTMTQGWNAGYNIMDSWDKHGGSGESNQIRMGGVSHIADSAAITNDGDGVKGAYRGNYTGDHTIDELYFWNSGNVIDTAIADWYRGRYYKPLDSTYGEGIFTSQAITFASSTPRTLAPPTSIPTPGGTGGTTSGGTGSGTVPVVSTQIRILGLSWTWYGEGTDPATGRPTLYDYNSPTGVAVKDVQPQVLCGIRDGTVNYGPYDQDGFSAVVDPTGVIPVMQDPKNVKYFVQFKLPGASGSTILLASPVLDDITIYWDDSKSHLLSYTFDNRTF